MTRLPGFAQGRWRTGFTNFRFAIPDLAGGHGRAIYNDVDQIYLADPAPLFDLPMGDAGYLALTPADTAVMLLDCARMAERVDAGARAAPGQENPAGTGRRETRPVGAAAGAVARPRHGIPARASPPACITRR